MTGVGTGARAGAAPVRVAVNLLWCIPGKVGGSEQYLIRQLIGLHQVDSTFEPHLFVLPGLIESHPHLGELFAYTVAPISGQQRGRRVIAESTWLRSRTKPFDLVHHGGGTAPRRSTHPYLLTIHDLQYRDLPENFSPLKLRYLRTVMPRAVSQSAAVAVPTDFVRRTVIDAFGDRADAHDLADRVVVVPHGFDTAVEFERTPEPELRHRFRLGTGPVLVYPAVTHPHKNHRFLIDMMATRWTDRDLRLVLCGGAGSSESTVASVDDPRVIRVGRISDADRNGLLAMATAMVFPSTYEGFGAPLIEAMALGAAVLASDAACIPEIVGNAGIIRPLNADAWAEGLETLITTRADLVRRGIARAADFSLSASGTALAAAYRTALRA